MTISNLEHLSSVSKVERIRLHAQMPKNFKRQALRSSIHFEFRHQNEAVQE